MIKPAKKIDDAALRGRLLFDINVLSIAPSNEIFITARNLFLRKWVAICNTVGVEEVSIAVQGSVAARTSTLLVLRRINRPCFAQQWS